MNLGGTIRLNRTGFCLFLAIFILLLLYMTTGRDKPSKVDDAVKTISLRDLLAGSIEAARRGGREITNLKGPLDIRNKGKTKEGVNDSLTNADIKSHCAMYGSLRETFTQVNIVSEEEQKCKRTDDLKMDLANDKLRSVNDAAVPVDDVTIWIDPLDATKEYTEKKYQYVTTMVCVAVKGRPVIGVIHRPFYDETSWAWVKNAQSDDLKPPADEGTAKPKIIISISHPGEVKQTIQDALGADVDIILAAGAGYKALEVASGNATAYYHTTSIKKWDICAGNAILNALGGKMTTSNNDDIDYSSTGTGKVVNDKGLLATVHNHDWYIGRLARHKAP